ncbi:RCC1 domain-containing protein 1-like [Glandiceps talaboti]
MRRFGFGFNGFGQLLSLRDEMQSIPHPTQLNIECMECKMEDVTMVTANWSTICYLTGNDKKLHLQDDQQAGEIDLEERFIFRPFDLQVPVNQVSCGKEHVLLLSNTGEVYSLGLGSRGQLGHGTSEKESLPRVIEALQGVAMATVAAGGWHSAAVSAIGDVYVWGWNEAGQLGLPMKDAPDRSRSKEEQSADFSQSGQENYKGCITKETKVDTETILKLEVSPISDQEKERVRDENIDTGQNTSQKMKQTDMEQTTSVTTDKPSFNDDDDKDVIVLCQMVPCLLEFPDEVNISKVSCGSRHTVAISETGNVYTWGWNGYGQLGHGDYVSRDVITLVKYFKENDYKVYDATCGPWNTILSVTIPQ